MASFTYAELAGLWIEAGGSGQEAGTAAAIAEAESKGCQYAKAGPVDDRPVKECTYRQTTKEDSYGLWQINHMAHPSYVALRLYDPLYNAEAAVAIYTANGSFNAWTTYRTKAYRKYLQTNFTPTIPDLGPGQTTGTGGLSNEGTNPTASGSRGYSDLRNSVARHLPTQLNRSRRAGAATLRTLSQRRKVKG